jgi:hypothetical protein
LQPLDLQHITFLNPESAPIFAIAFISLHTAALNGRYSQIHAPDLISASVQAALRVSEQCSW